MSIDRRQKVIHPPYAAEQTVKLNAAFRFASPAASPSAAATLPACEWLREKNHGAFLCRPSSTADIRRCHDTLLQPQTRLLGRALHTLSTRMHVLIVFIHGAPRTRLLSRRINVLKRIVFQHGVARW